MKHSKLCNPSSKYGNTSTSLRSPRMQFVHTIILLSSFQVSCMPSFCWIFFSENHKFIPVLTPSCCYSQQVWLREMEDLSPQIFSSLCFMCVVLEPTR